MGKCNDYGFRNGIVRSSLKTLNKLKRRYLIQCGRTVSGIICIMYTQSQKIVRIVAEIQQI